MFYLIVKNVLWGYDKLHFVILEMAFAQSTKQLTNQRILSIESYMEVLSHQGERSSENLASKNL